MYNQKPHNKKKKNSLEFKFFLCIVVFESEEERGGKGLRWSRYIFFSFLDICIIFRFLFCFVLVFFFLFLIRRNVLCMCVCR
jgi:hypothetical protein